MFVWVAPLLYTLESPMKFIQSIVKFRNYKDISGNDIDPYALMLSCREFAIMDDPRFVPRSSRHSPNLSARYFMGALDKR